MKTRILLLTTLALCRLCHPGDSLFAQGTAFTYQGRLDSGTNVANGTYNLTFALFNTNSGGSPLAGPVTNSAVNVSNGLFTVAIDFGGVFTNATNWLEIAVETNGGGSFTTLAPRQQLTPTPYAIYAEGGNAAGLTGTIPMASLSGTYGAAVYLTNAGNNFVGTGAGVSNVDAAALGGLSSSSFWQLGGNNAGSGAFLGTTNNQVMDIRVNNVRAVRFRLTTDGLGLFTNAPNIIMGSSVNSMPLNIVGGTIAGGGGNDTSSNADVNTVTADFGTVGGGVGNKASGAGSVIGGGGFEGSTVEGNTASGNASVIGGGLDNTASLFVSTVAGGAGNTASGNSFGAATVGGGELNTASGDYAAVSGGAANIASGVGSFVGGGGTDGSTGFLGLLNTWPNSAMGKATVIGGGLGNTNNNYGGTIGGGTFNTTSGTNSTVAGGGNNSAAGTSYGYATVGGGSGNTSTIYATVSGGIENSAGGYSSFVGGGGYAGSTYAGNLAGGEASVIGGGLGNLANGHGSFIGGGGYDGDAGDTGGNSATGGGSVIGGGVGNICSGKDAVVYGGMTNTASGLASVVFGGSGNVASAAYTFAGGLNAHAIHQGAFVWADNIGLPFYSDVNNEFAVRAINGVRFVTEVDTNGNTVAGVALYVASTSWSTLCDRNAKKNFQPVDGEEVLDKLAQVPVQRWNYKWEKDDSVPHIGPMAQDFKQAFYPGRDDKSISTLEFDGVELAAIKGLNKKLDEQLKSKDAEIQDLKARLDRLEELVGAKNGDGK